MQHLETWLLIPETDRVLCNVMNQWSVLAILLFAKNADNENKKCLKKLKSTFSRPLSLFGIFGGVHSTDSCQKMAGNFGNRGINLRVFICSCHNEPHRLSNQKKFCLSS